MNPFILTLELNDELARALTALRTRYFPPDRNYLDAHVTLFHALPAERLVEVTRDVSTLARDTSVFTVRVPTCYSLGRGVALDVVAPRIAELRRDLRARWLDHLGPQDRAASIRPHVTIQNKVDGDAAKRTLHEVTGAWNAATRGTARGFGVWEYLGGPWRHHASFAFKDAD